jgi:serine/threonine protein kinase
VTPEIPVLPGLTDLHPLGRGGFADVYRGRQAHLDRFVAAKVFRVTLAERAASDQFRAECQAVGRLDGHPNLIKVYSADVLSDGRPYIITEACDTSLQVQLQQRGPRQVDDVRELGLTLARALLYAHSAGVLHGDVTPQNVLLRSTGAPVLADFGLAVLRDYQGNIATGFTMTHAAPETLRYDGAIDERTDVYGLGSTLYTALTGAPPIPPRPGEPDPAHINRVLTEVPLRAAGPAWIADLLAAMLAKAPAARPSLIAVADALEAGEAAPPIVQPPDAPLGAPVYAPPTDVPAASPQVVSPPYAPPPSAQPEWAPASESTRLRAAQAGPAYAPPPGQDATRLRAGSKPPESTTRPSRPKWLIPVAAAVVLVALGGGLYAFLRSGDGGPVPTPTTSAAPSGQAATGIELDRPVDNGSTVQLTWHSAGSDQLDYAVLIGQPGAAPTVKLVGRVGSYSVPVEPGRQYCFQIQGSNQAGTVSESNVQPVRNAVCRFTSS